MTYVMGVMALVVAFETWCLWRVLDRLSVVGRVEDRLATLTHTLALLTDTTETCFQAIAGQIDPDRPRASAERAMRQRRVVGAARRGRSVTDIANLEHVAESEVRLRLHLADPDGRGDGGRHGSMRA